MKLFGHHVHPPILLLAIAEFGLAALSFWLAASIVAPWSARGVGTVVAVGWTLLFATVVVLGLTAVGLYQAKQRLRIEGVLVRLGVVIGAIAVAFAFFGFLSPALEVNISWALSLIFCVISLGFTRVMFEKFVDHAAFRRHVLVYGAGARAANLIKLRRRSDQRGFKIVAFIPAPGDQGTLSDERVTTLTSPLRDYAEKEGIDEIVVAMDERRSGFPIKDLLDCKFAGVAVIDLLNFMERETGKVRVDLVNPAWLIFSEGFSTQPFRLAASRLLDLMIVAVLAFVALPLMIATVVAVLIEDGRPVLYRQRRVGYRGEPFVLYKFRSMVKDAEPDGKAKWAGQQDDRVTKVGRVIRKLRFDELPQLFNVLVGDMSIVGPRPERPEFVDRLQDKIPYYAERHSVKPGITGWAQLNFPYGSSDEDAMEKLQFDLYYVKHRGLFFDLMVLLQTVEVVLWGKGAR